MHIGEDTKVWKQHLSNIGDAVIGKHCTIHAPVWIGDEVRIGNYCKVQAFAFIPQGVMIMDNVFIGPHVCFTNDREPPSGGKWQVTIVQKGVSIGAGAIILPGITLHEGCRIGAGAVVTNSVGPGETVVGNPARKVIHKIDL